MVQQSQPIQTSRRIVFQGMGALGVACVLAACGSGGSDSGGDGGSAGDAGGGGVSAGTVLTPTADVPVGGGIVLADQGVVVTQPTEGEFKAFSSACTHQGNTVTGVEDGVIECSFHGSSFSAETGEVEGGPAPSALAEVPVSVEGADVVAA